MTGTSDRKARVGEFKLIAKLFAPLAQAAPGAFGLTDDAAIMTPPPGQELVLTTDAVVEGVHFHRSDPPDAVAQKALRVNLSDIAAKGSVPVGYLLALLLPEWPDMTWLEAFAGGLAADQSQFGLSLLGGDTSATTGPLAIVISAFGIVPHGAMIRRATARPGDIVFVSGTIGDAGGGLALLNGAGAGLTAADREMLVGRYRLPLPKLALGESLRSVASAALDVSDGLVADLGHLAQSSQVRIEIDAPRIPLSASLRTLWGEDQPARIRAAIAGDDYEIAFTAPPGQRKAVLDCAARCATPVTEIGRVRAGEGVALLDGAGVEIALPHKGFVHF
jgi:thiamine-monophosphate kinase